MFTSSIDRLASWKTVERRLGNQFEAGCAQLLEQRAKGFPLDSREALEVGSENADRECPGRVRDRAHPIHSRLSAGRRADDPNLAGGRGDKR